MLTAKQALPDRQVRLATPAKPVRPVLMEQTARLVLLALTVLMERPATQALMEQTARLDRRALTEQTAKPGRPVLTVKRVRPALMA